jgi:hypothetical protein
MKSQSSQSVGTSVPPEGTVEKEARWSESGRERR